MAHRGCSRHSLSCRAQVGHRARTMRSPLWYLPGTRTIKSAHDVPLLSRPHKFSSLQPHSPSSPSPQHLSQCRRPRDPVVVLPVATRPPPTPAASPRRRPRRARTPPRTPPPLAPCALLPTPVVQPPRLAPRPPRPRSRSRPAVGRGVGGGWTLMDGYPATSSRCPAL